jgi:TolA-binding protein
MTNRRFTLLTFAAVALATFAAPASAGAQTIWDRMRDRAEQQRDRDPDWRRDRRDDDRYGRGRVSDYERRQLRDLARRIDDRSRELQRDVDRLLDNSRINGTNREDRINNEARDLRQAAERFRNVAGDGDRLERSRDEAGRLLQEASRFSRMLGRLRMDSRTANDWNQLRSDLRAVANIYNLRFNDDRGYNVYNDDDWRRNRRW